MGDMQVLQDQLEIGMPFEAAALLAGFTFEEIEVLERDQEINHLVQLSEANLMSKHLTRVNASDNDRMSTWMLERKFPKFFSQTTKLQTPNDNNLSVTIKGINPEKEKPKSKRKKKTK